MNTKLNILVRVDLDHARAQVVAKGHITVHSVQALYIVVKRANSLRQGLDLEVDITNAWVDADALQQLQDCSRSRHLPAKIDPMQKPCNVSVLAPRHNPVAGAALIAA